MSKNDRRLIPQGVSVGVYFLPIWKYAEQSPNSSSIMPSVEEAVVGAVGALVKWL
jgi:hypothetical protein